MNGSVFPRATLDRAAVDWSEHLSTLTPVEERSPDRWYKREDYFAPLGYGGINGAKLRQCIHLIGRYAMRLPGGAWGGVVTGCSVLSPQGSMAALVARHYDLPCVILLGGSKPETCLRHENVAIAAEVGAEFIHVPVGYNPALQRAVRDESQERPMWYRLCYGITTPETASDEEVATFHAVGARQAENVPESVGTLVMPAGSCNSCVSVLYGLALHRPAGLRRVVLLGVGPTRLQWIEDRLEAIERATGHELRSLYRRLYHHHRELEYEHQTDGPILLEHFDLHSTKFASYGDRMPASCDGIDFHPTYEGKVIRYMNENRGQFAWWHHREEPVLFWIVGSAPSLRAMTDAFVFDGIGAYGGR